MTTRLLWIAIILHLALCSQVQGTAEEPDTTYPALYQWGKEAYTKERWYECVAFMKRAFEDYDYYQATIVDCQKRCQKKVGQDTFPLTDEQALLKAISEVRVYEHVVQRSMSLKRCMHERLGDRPVWHNAKIVEEDFVSLKPYSYMQLCYWKLGDLQNAVSAAYTYYIRNSNDSMMKENLQFYSTQPGFSNLHYKDLRENEHEIYYQKGVDFYDNEDYENAALNFEKCLEKFLKKYESCRFVCVQVSTTSSPEPTSDYTDIFSVFSGPIENILMCRSMCLKSLSNIRGTVIFDLVPLILNYLQFSYWKTNKLRKTAEVVATFLEFHPRDPTMIDNRNFYATSFKSTDDLFVPRQELVNFKNQYVLDFKLLLKMNDRMRLENNEYPTEHPDDYKSLDSTIDREFQSELQNFFENKNSVLGMEKREAKESSITGPLPPPSVQKEKVPSTAMTEATSKFGNEPFEPDAALLNWYQKYHGLIVTNREWELSGTHRFVAENLLTDYECRQLLKLREVAQLGSGYNGKGSPHSKHETFYGLTFGQLIQHTVKSTVPINLAQLFYDKSELARNFVERYFNLSSHLYVDYTHLACRTAKSENLTLRNDLSHAIHGDNCMFKDGRCDKKHPAFTWRDFSALIYLNDDFDGGEFIFADENERESVSIKPACGRMVAFIGSALHGVKAVKKGTRCALALWMTLDPAHQEQERNLAANFLNARKSLPAHAYGY